MDIDTIDTSKSKHSLQHLISPNEMVPEGCQYMQADKNIEAVSTVFVDLRSDSFQAPVRRQQVGPLEETEPGQIMPPSGGGGVAGKRHQDHQGVQQDMRAARCIMVEDI